MSTELSDRFFAKVYKTPNCWFWIASRDSRGYGTFKVGTKTVGSHRVSWFIHNGSIKETENVLHKCDNPQCVNPEHLFIGTMKDNLQDAARKGSAANLQLKNKPFCKYGHPRTEKNSYTNPNTGHRRCRICFNLAMRIWQKKNRYRLKRQSFGGE